MDIYNVVRGEISLMDAFRKLIRFRDYAINTEIIAVAMIAPLINVNSYTWKKVWLLLYITWEKIICRFIVIAAASGNFIHNVDSLSALFRHMVFKAVGVLCKFSMLHVILQTNKYVILCRRDKVHKVRLVRCLRITQNYTHEFVVFIYVEYLLPPHIPALKGYCGKQLNIM